MPFDLVDSKEPVKETGCNARTDVAEQQDRQLR